MAEYRLSDLDNQEFETLCNDLAEILTKAHVERFTPGRDSGIDGRFTSTDGGKTIIQSKHYAGSGWKGLKAAAKSEAAKLAKLKPSRYMLFTSVGLTPANKATLKAMLSPFVLSEEDIFGKDEILALLDQHNDIVLRHYKLWAISGSMMRSLLFQGFDIAIKARLEALARKASGYAVTDLHENALAMLKQTKMILITGTPGIGKTTLAEQLLLASVGEGYAPFFIGKDVDEAYPHLRPGDEKQVFFFDDFLGSNFLDALRPHEDSTIRDFMDIVRGGNKRLILTSRSHILDQGYDASDTLKHCGLRQSEFLLDIKALPQSCKAAILSRMLLRSPDLAGLEAFLDIHFFRRTLLHPNFTPRIIETIVNDLADSPADSPDSAKNRILSGLKNPADIWKHAFEREEDEASRILTILVALSGRDIEEQELEDLWHTCRTEGALPQTSSRRITFQNVAAALCRSFLCREVERTNSGDRAVFRPANPSVTDYICSILSEDEWVRALRALNSNDSLRRLATLHPSRKVQQRVAERLLEDPVSPIGGWSYAYVAQLGILAGDDCFRKVFPAGFASTFVDILHEYEFQIFHEELAIRFFKRLEQNFGHAGHATRKAFCLILARSAYHIDFIDCVAELTQELGVYDASLHDALKNSAKECLPNIIYEMLNNDLDSYAIWTDPDEDNDEGRYELPEEEQLAADVLHRINRIHQLLTYKEVKEQLDSMSDSELFGYREVSAALQTYEQQLRELEEVHREFTARFHERMDA